MRKATKKRPARRRSDDPSRPGPRLKNRIRSVIQMESFIEAAIRIAFPDEKSFSDAANKLLQAALEKWHPTALQAARRLPGG